MNAGRSFTRLIFAMIFRCLIISTLLAVAACNAKPETPVGDPVTTRREADSIVTDQPADATSTATPADTVDQNRSF